MEGSLLFKAGAHNLLLLKSLLRLGDLASLQEHFLSV